jgi:ASC-1-like (ASCH) protein
VNTGEKIYEIRLDTDKNKEIQVGDQILFQNYEKFYRDVNVKVVAKEIYDSFEECLVEKGIGKCVPGAADLEAALKIYNDLYFGIMTKNSKILCWTIEKVK